MAEATELKVYEKILEIASQSSERDARLETRMEDFDRRLSTLEEQQKVSQQQQIETQEVLHDLKNLIDGFQSKLNKDWAKFQRIEKKFLEAKEGDEMRKKNCDERFSSLENNIREVQDTPKNLWWKCTKQAVGMLFVALVGAGIAYLFMKLGIKK